MRDFILDEENALRKALLGITVSDQRDGDRRVNVRFAQPDLEIGRQSFPFITIDLIDVRRAPEREHRGIAAPAYDMPADAIPGRWQIDYPIPVDLIFQITTYARHVIHDRKMLSAILTEKAPFRFGALYPDDNTVRRLDVLDVSLRPETEAGKRLFKNAITVAVTSELPPVTSAKYEPVLNRFITFGFTVGAQPGNL